MRTAVTRRAALSQCSANAVPRLGESCDQVVQRVKWERVGVQAGAGHQEKLEVVGHIPLWLRTKCGLGRALGVVGRMAGHPRETVLSDSWLLDTEVTRFRGSVLAERTQE